MTNFFFDSTIMLRFGKTKVAIEEFYGAKKLTITRDVNVYNIVSKLIETKPNSKFLIGYLDEVIKPLVLVMPQMNYVKT